MASAAHHSWKRVHWNRLPIALTVVFIATTSYADDKPSPHRIGTSFLVFRPSVPVKKGNETLSSLKLGDVVKALDYANKSDISWILVRVSTSKGQVEGWVNRDNLVNTLPLREVGIHVVAYDDGKGFEIHLSRKIASDLSLALQKVNEDKVAGAVRTVVSPAAKAAGAATAIGVTGNPTAGTLGSSLADWVCSALINMAKANLTKFKAELAANAGQGDINIVVKPHLDLIGNYVGGQLRASANGIQWLSKYLYGNSKAVSEAGSELAYQSSLMSAVWEHQSTHRSG